jgi:hypothetical protein
MDSVEKPSGDDGYGNHRIHGKHVFGSAHGLVHNIVYTLSHRLSFIEKITFTMLLVFALLLLTILEQSSGYSSGKGMSQTLDVEYWLTTGNKNVLFQRQPNAILSSNPAQSDVTIDASVSGRRQVMEGFGWCLTGGSAQLLFSQPTFASLFEGAMRLGG